MASRHLEALRSMREPKERKTFQQVKEWLEAIPDQAQADGPPCAHVHKGVEYEEFMSAYTCRDNPLDRELAETYCCHDFISQINSYRATHKGTMYWRIGFEWDTWNSNIITEVVCTRGQCKDDPVGAQAKINQRGAVMDPITDDWVVYDKGFVTLKCYARMAMTDQKPEWPEGTQPKAFLGLVH